MGTKEYHTLRTLLNKLNNLDDIKGQHKVGAVILDRKNNVLSIGYNSYIKTHPKQYIYNKHINPTRIFLHAEIDALVRCRGEPYTMIVARIGKDSKVRLAKPCKGCFNAIKDTKVKKVFFTNNNGELVLLDTDMSLDNYEEYNKYYL